jgi:hypothetical protein
MGKALGTVVVQPQVDWQIASDAQRSARELEDSLSTRKHAIDESL